MGNNSEAGRGCFTRYFFCSDSFETIQEVETKIEEIDVMVTKVSYLRVHWRHVKGRKRIFI